MLTDHATFFVPFEGRGFYASRALWVVLERPQALEGGDLVAARAATTALYEFTSRLALAEDGAADAAVAALERERA